MKIIGCNGVKTMKIKGLNDVSSMKMVIIVTLATNQRYRYTLSLNSLKVQYLLGRIILVTIASSIVPLPQSF